MKKSQTSFKESTPAVLAKLKKRWPSQRWKPVPGYEDLYWVSDFGKVYSVVADDLALFLKTKNKSWAVKLVRDSLTSWPAVQYVVAQAFIPNPDPVHKTYVGHLNSDRLDNRVCNLMWMHKSTILDRMKEATQKLQALGVQSISSPRYLKQEDVRMTRASHAAGVPVRIIAQELGVNKNSVYNVLSGHTWGNVE